MIGHYYIAIIVISFVCVTNPKILPEIPREIERHNRQEQFENRSVPPEIDNRVAVGVENRDSENRHDDENQDPQNGYDVTERQQQNVENNYDITQNKINNELDDDNWLGSTKNNENDASNELTSNKENSLNDLIEHKEEERKWVIVTGKYTKKHRKTNFADFKIEKTNILEKFELEKEWKRIIVKAIHEGERTVRPAIRRPTLKSPTGNALTILTDDATFRTSSNGWNTLRYNITCTYVETYECTIPLSREVVVQCWRPPTFWCTEVRREYSKANCRRSVQKCCEGYYLDWVTGYCEKPPPIIATTTTTTTTATTETRPSSRVIAPTKGPEDTCGGTLTSLEGVITSPNHPQFYPNEQNCKWTIKAPPGFKVALKIINLAIEDPVGACDLTNWKCFKFCEFDRLKITDVTTGESKALCGYRSPTSQYVSTGNTVEIKFESDVSSGGRGFKMVYALASEYDLSSFHPECTGGQTWQICRRRCARPCKNHSNSSTIICIESGTIFRPIPYSSRNEITCVPGCACPPDKPIWHAGTCMKPESCPDDIFQCGKPAVKSKLKIVGGRTAGKHASPWMVQIESESLFHICGATLVCSNWVITAAHCFLDIERTKLDLTLAKYLINVGKYWKDEQMDGRVVQTYDPEKIIAHPGYRVNTDTKVDTHDIALIRLSHAVDVTDYVRPACLPHPTLQGVTSENSKYAKYQQPTTGTMCKVLGWGTTQGTGPSSEKLKEAFISVQPGSSCKYSSYVWKLMICAGGHKDQDTCRGDSGGPLLCQRREGKWFLDGITSFGDSCGEEGVAGGYTRISGYIGWIRKYTGYKCEL